MMTQESLPNRGYEIRSKARFLNEAETSFFKAGAYIFRLLMYGQEKELRIGHGQMEFMCGLDPIQDWHGYIQNNHIGTKPLCFGDKSSSVLDGPNQVKIRSQERDHAVKQELIIVRKEDSWTRTYLLFFWCRLRVTFNLFFVIITDHSGS